MIHLFLNNAGELMATDKMPEETMSVPIADKEFKGKFRHNCELVESAKASAVKVKNVESLPITWVITTDTSYFLKGTGLMEVGKIYSLEGYKMEIKTVCKNCGVSEDSDCDVYKMEECNFVSEKIAVIVPIAEQKSEPPIGAKNKNLMKRAQWLHYCLEIGWPKESLDGLQKVWDDHYDEFGNVIQKPTKDLMDQVLEKTPQEIKDKVTRQMAIIDFKAKLNAEIEMKEFQIPSTDFKFGWNKALEEVLTIIDSYDRQQRIHREPRTLGR